MLATGLGIDHPSQLTYGHKLPDHGYAQKNDQPSAKPVELSPSVIVIRSQHYQASSSYSLASLNTPEPVVEVDKPAVGAVKASSNILTLIEAQLLRDLADGATVEELESRLQAGFDGFERGFSEAAEILKLTEGMNEQIWGEIKQTHALVTEGIEALRERFVGVDTALEDTFEAVAPLVQEPPPEASVASVYLRGEAAEKNSFAFKLVTADGDTVIITASSLRASIVETYVTHMDDVRQQMQDREAQHDRFSLKVTGELDQQELTAIYDLLNQVGDLSEQFFAGNLEQAFTMATELGYDSSEIASFALNLSHTSVRRMTQAYQAVQPERPPMQLADGFQALGDYVDKFMEAYQSASRFSGPAELLQRLAPQFEHSNTRAFSKAIDYLLQGQS